MDSSLVVVFKDDDLLVLNKPACLLTIRDGYNSELPNLQTMAEREFGRLWVVHRLDKETSGLVVFALNPETHRILNTQFQERLVQKKYHLLATGHLSEPSITIDLPLRVNGDRRHRTVVDKLNGKSALTKFTQISRLHEPYFFLEAAPASGYTHQIRAHASNSGLWLLNDPLYFPQQGEQTGMNIKMLTRYVEELPIKRLALHAYSIRFRNPHKDEMISFQADVPTDFLDTINQIKISQNKSVLAD